MNAKEFLLKELRVLAQKFPKLKVRYEKDTLSKTHFIEIIPLAIYEQDGFIFQEVDLIRTFDKLFPDEEVCFFSEDNTYRFQEPITIASLSSVSSNSYISYVANATTTVFSSYGVSPEKSVITDSKLMITSYDTVQSELGLKTVAGEFSNYKIKAIGINGYHGIDSSLSEAA